MRKLLITLALTLVLCTSVFAHGQTLQEASRQAIESNPQVQASWHEFLASLQGIRAASAGYRPRVDLNARFGHERRDFSTPQLNRRDNFTGADASISLIQNLYDGFRTRSEVGRFEEIQLIRYFELLSDVESTALDAVAAYQDVLRQRELVALARDNLSNHHTVFDQLSESAAAGISRSVDLEQISGRMALAETNLVTEMSNLHDVSSRYQRIVGTPPRPGLMPVAINDEGLPGTVVETLRLAYEGNPTFHASIKNIAVSEQRVKTEKSNFHPRLDLAIRAGTQSYDDFGFSNSQSDARIGLELQYNLYRGGADRANLREAYEQVNVAKDQRDLECTNLRQTVQIAFNDIQKIQVQLDMLNQHRLASDRVRTAYKNQFDIGQRTLLDVLDAENEFFQASRAYVDAQADLNIARARTLASTGQLLNALDVVREGLPTLEELGAQPVTISGMSVCPPLDALAHLPEAQDEDGDGVPDYLDFCPGTPEGHKVDRRGCTVTERHERTFEAELTFRRDSARLQPGYKESLEDIVAFIIANPEARVLIEGHASLPGTAAYNQRLSERRAEAVAQVLRQEFDIDEERISIFGFGDTRPLVPGDSDEANEVNRRIEIIVTLEEDRPQMRQ